MPYLSLTTNCEISAKRETMLLHLLSSVVVKETGKNEKYVMVSIRSKQKLLMAGSTAPAAYVEFSSIGLDPLDHAPISKAICSALEGDLDIPKDRIYILFQSVPGKSWGWNGGTIG